MMPEIKESIRPALTSRAQIFSRARSASGRFFVTVTGNEKGRTLRESSSNSVENATLL